MVPVDFSVLKTFSLPLRFFSYMHFLESWLYHLRAPHKLRCRLSSENQLEILDMNVLTL